MYALLGSLVIPRRSVVGWTRLDSYGRNTMDLRGEHERIWLCWLTHLQVENGMLELNIISGMKFLCSRLRWLSIATVRVMHYAFFVKWE